MNLALVEKRDVLLILDAIKDKISVLTICYETELHPGYKAGFKEDIGRLRSIEGNINVQAGTDLT